MGISCHLVKKRLATWPAFAMASGFDLFGIKPWQIGFSS